MSAYALTSNGYLDATKSTGNPRDVEYQLFSRVTGRLNAATVEGTSFAQLAEALQENLSLWREIAMDVTDEGNGLPAQLRAQLFYLYEFTMVHTQKVLQNEADPAALIDINTSIMRGLRSRLPGKGTE